MSAHVVFAAKVAILGISVDIIVNIVHRTDVCIKCHHTEWYRGSHLCDRCGLCGDCDDSSLKYGPGMCQECTHEEWMRRQIRSGHWQ